MREERMPLRWSGFADLAFAESAWLAFARAAELAETDVHELHRDAWVIDDQHIAFSLETESSRSTVEAMERFLGLLVLQAEDGEAAIEIVEPRSRWVRRAVPASGELPQGTERTRASSTLRAIKPSGRATG
jgi:hypothetical protein